MRRYSAIPLRRWVPIVVVGAFTLLLVASGLWREWRDASLAEERAREFVTQRVTYAQHRIERLLRDGDTALVAEEIAQLGALPDAVNVALVDDEGRIVAANQAALRGRTMREALPAFDPEVLRRAQRGRLHVLVLDAAHARLLAFQPIVLRSKPGEIRPTHLGALLLAYDLAGNRAAVRRELLVSTGVEIAFALVVMGVVMFMLRRWLSLPLSHLQQAVRRISRGDFTTELELAGTGELADLGVDIRRMEADLKAAAAERDRQEAALRESAENLETTLHSIGDAVVATDAAGRVTRMNPAAERLTAWPVAEAVGRPLTEVFRIVNAKTRAAAADPVQLVLERNDVVALANHTTLLSRDGTEHQIADSAAPIRDAAGTVLGVVLVFSDVTEQYRVREALARTTEMLEHTGTLARVGGWELDLRTNALYWSRETCRIHEVDPPVAPPLQDAINFYAPEARPVITAAVTAAMERGVPYDVELPLITATGRRIWVRAQCSPVIDEGRVILLRGAFHDITDRKHAEQEREASHALLVNLARLVPSAIYQYRLYPDGRSAFPYASPAIETIYEVTPEEVQEDATPVFGRLHPEDAERVGQLIQDSARTLETFYCEFRVLLPRQGVRWRWSQAQPERTDDGGTLWHGIISDITERKEAEAAQRELQGQLMQAQKMESVGLLAGGVAHDFNNMLGVIMGNVDLVLAQLGPGHPVSTDLLEIQQAAQRSADLTRQLLAFARKQEVRPRVLDLNDQVTNSLKMLQRLIGENIALTWEPGAALWPVSLDPSQIDQVLTNLCVNARAAIADVGEVTIATTNCTLDADACAAIPDATPGDYVRLSMSDTGCGMAPETLARIFEPFFTTKGIGQGTGLGLSMVYGAVRQNGGFIRVSSAPGRGTTFELFLPRHRDHAAVARPARPAAAVDPTHRGRETVLVVEDEASVLRLATRILERQGYTVLGADGPRQAIDMARAHAGRIHLLLTDVVMPTMNGRDLANLLLTQYPGMRRLFMSGHTKDIIAQHGLVDAGVALLEKPFSAESLLAGVREVLDRE